MLTGITGNIPSVMVPDNHDDSDYANSSGNASHNQSNINYGNDDKYEADVDNNINNKNKTTKSDAYNAAADDDSCSNSQRNNQHKQPATKK